jgi:hypothetical protein
MEWATCVDLTTGAIEVVNTTFEQEWMEGSRAFNRGTPSTVSVRARITMSLDDLRPSKDAETDYLRAFRLQMSRRTTGGHLVFEVNIGSVRYLIPALALMRTLFTPARYLLDTMFRPHALDQTCFLDFGSSETRLKMLASWATEANARRFAAWDSRLKWMLSHQSAFRMAGSVHDFASRGIIGLLMPLATISATVEGIREGNNFFVTKCTLLTIEPKEAPSFNMKATPLIVAHNNPQFLVAVNTGSPRAVTIHVPVHADGSLDITDSEWAILRPVVLRQSASRYKLCPRLLLDGVLSKLASGKGWPQTRYKVGNWQNASYTFQALRKSGALDEVMAFLRSTRTNLPGPQSCEHMW